MIKKEFESGSVIYWGDAEEILSGLQDNLVALTITSPPYNNQTKYNSYDDNKPIDFYTKKMHNIFKEIYRITVDGGRVIINVPLVSNNCGNIFILPCIYNDIMTNIGFVIKDVIIWVKSTQNSYGYPSTSWGSWCSPSSPNMRSMAELLIIFAKNSIHYKKVNGISDITPEEFKEYTKNIWFIPQDREKFEHPCPFAIDITKRLIKLYSYVDDIVLDPFAGIGTTLVSASYLKRKFIGIEIDKKYYDIMEKRLILSESKII